MLRNIAHRGFSKKHPENTMLAFKKAVELEVDSIELDVHLTKDGRVVIIHDETLMRTTGEPGYVADYIYDDLKKFDASKPFANLEYKNPIPTLEEYFELVKDTDIITNIELKTGLSWPIGIEDKVLKIIKNFNLEKKVIITSFNHYAVAQFKKIAPNIKCGFIVEANIIDSIPYLKKYNIDAYQILSFNITKENLKEFHDNNIEINVWTVDDIDQMKTMIDLGVDGIITNRPDVLKTLLNK